jgi:hypothetical protein
MKTEIAHQRNILHLELLIFVKTFEFYLETQSRLVIKTYKGIILKVTPPNFNTQDYIFAHYLKIGRMLSGCCRKRTNLPPAATSPLDSGWVPAAGACNLPAGNGAQLIRTRLKFRYRSLVNS